jgi:hypothetical protein
MTNQKQVLQTYMDIITMLKENLTRDLLKANQTETIILDNLNLQRVVALTTNLVDQYGAQGYELLQRLPTETTRRTKK